MDRESERVERAARRDGQSRTWLRCALERARRGESNDAAEAARSAVLDSPTSSAVRRCLSQLGLGRGPWPGRLGDSDNRCQSFVDGARIGELAWSLSLPGSPCGTPVVGPDGRISVTTERGDLYVINARGAVEHRDEDWDPSVPPTVTKEGRLAAICRRRGPLRSNLVGRFPARRRPRPEDLFPAYIDRFHGRIMGVYDNQVQLFEEAHAGLFAQLTTPAQIWARPVPSFDRSGRCLVGSMSPSSGELLCLEPDGSLAWRFESRSAIPGPVTAACADQRCVARIGDQVYGLDRRGRVRWHHKTHLADWWRIPSGDSLPPVAIWEDRALIATSWGVMAVDLKEGRQIFQRPDLTTNRAAAIDRSGVAHLAVPGRLVGIDLRGETVYELRLPGRGRAAEAPALGFFGQTLVIALDTLLAIR